MISNSSQRGSIAAMLILIFIPASLCLPCSYPLIVNLLCAGLFTASLVYSREPLPLLVATKSLKRVAARTIEGI